MTESVHSAVSQHPQRRISLVVSPDSTSINVFDYSYAWDHLKRAPGIPPTDTVNTAKEPDYIDVNVVNSGQ